MRLVDGRPVYAATDLVAFLACTHLLALERAALADLVKRPVRNDPEIDLIAKRGLDHEHRYLAELRAEGRRVVEIAKLPDDLPYGDRLRGQAEATRAAMTSGADVIYQATFFDGTWLGYADFLLRVERASDLGTWSYEIADTKLARRTKASAILQICSYVEQLHRVQGLEPVELHVVLGGSKRQKETFRVADFMAYYRRVRTEFEAALTAGAPVYPVVTTYPDPVEHCDICRWAVHCRLQRRQDDDLSLVAGISARQRKALKDRGVSTRRGLAALHVPMSPRLERVSGEALLRVQAQARIQVEGEDERRPKWELLDPERDEHGVLVRDRGFLGLPPPSGADLFFDIEGDPFAMDDGVEYLFGIVEPALPDVDDPVKPRYHEIWSRDPSGDVTLAAEKAALEALVDLLIDRLDANPAMHVYHYAAYERTALGKLAQRHATREAEVDRLLRGGVLVDLYRVVRQGVRASVESYSIKRLEPLYELERAVDLRSAGSSIVAFEAWLEGGTTEEGRVGEAILREIAGYNRDDVLSNWRLRDWLEDRRLDLERKIGEAVPRPVPEPLPEGSPELKAREAATLELVEALTAGVPADPAERSPSQQASWLLAQLLGWHRREDKAFWWRFFQLCAMTDEDLVDEREPIGMVKLVDDLGESGHGGRLQRFRFPPQDHSIKIGRSVIDPKTKKSTGTVKALDDVGLSVVLHRTKSEVERGMPGSLIPDEHVGTPEQEGSLLRIGRSVAELGIAGDGPHRAARDLLLRNPPRLSGSSPLWLRLPGESAVAAATRLGLALVETTLAIQGPPGSGKTRTTAEMIVALVRAGRRVGVTANSHQVIGNVLDKVDEAARRAGVPVRLGQKTGSDGEPTCAAARPLETNPDARAALFGGEIDVLGGTAWLWSRPEFVGSVDALFVDEAGQLSLANAIAVSPAGSSLVLVGDPQQLDQPTRGSHPPGAERSSLAHLLDGRPTIPEGVGLFLERTWRLHPDLCDYTSEVFYADQLEPQPELAQQGLNGIGPADGTGVRWLPIPHDGDATDSQAEADAIVSLVGALFAMRATWTNAAGKTQQIRLEDIVVLAPYNAHAELVRDALAAAGYPGARVGTVDKFQGQEAPISIYAMATSSAEEAPRGLEFLYSRNRLNVATSRARCVAIVVASPDLVRVQCHTPRQMTLANALCRLVELAPRA